MGLEIIEQVPDLDAVVIPVGGGGLIAGCAVALKTMRPNILIIVNYFFISENQQLDYFIQIFQIFRVLSLKGVPVSQMH
jgi:1-aminocyclopropane-1-carboxylate deaminase/D-cysteine desulfhydrase-like pyridoxal-dependent ACC family enzyme